ncbi:MAG TPA: AAA family ATPase [Saprospiraceae bacterium]|nr:AAA family ATPase [Saprospiraceae bacterium]
MDFKNLRIKNFKCFDEEGSTIETLKLINVIIGKNNSGKSSVIDVFKFIANGEQSFFTNKRFGRSPVLEFEQIITEEAVREFITEHRKGNNGYLITGLSFVNSEITCQINQQGKILPNINYQTTSEAAIFLQDFFTINKISISVKKFKHISAERDILKEANSLDFSVKENGIGATNFIQEIINRDIYDSDLIEKTLLINLNKVLNPDINFSRILVQQDEKRHWEIFFESVDDGRVPLSKMGSGVKTVLLVLILLHVIPAIEGLKPSDYIFALEELENNLHPSLQRRLYRYIYDFAIENNSIFLLTTHSNIVIDMYNSLEETQILHIVKNENKTIIKSTLNVHALNNILEDLDVRASDILQCNGIIWVEGPSDRIYINNWIKIIDKNLIEGYHYSIMFYGGRLLSNLTFDYELINKDLIPLLKLNKNSFVVIDRDGKKINPELNETKLRIQSEIGENRAWITKGREIENYISNDAIQKWLNTEYSIRETFDNDINLKLEDSLHKIDKSNEIKYNLNKNKYASEIIKHIDENNFDTLDLKYNLELIISAIKKWNKM